MKIFFIFDLTQDLFRVKKVLRECAAKGIEAVGVFSDVALQRLKMPKEDALGDFLDRPFTHEAVSVVLVENKTSENPWVRRAVRRSHEAGHGLVTIFIHNILNEKGERGMMGNDRFGELEKGLFYWQAYPTYRWVIDEGLYHIEHWIEKARQKAVYKRP